MAQTPPPAGDEDAPEPPRLRRLRLLVSALVVVLIAGVLTVVVSLVIKIAELGAGDTGPGVPGGPIRAERLELPAGQAVVAVGEGRGRLLVVTRDGQGAERLLAIDPDSGAVLSATPIRRGE